jgi:hypothetical protein
LHIKDGKKGRATILLNNYIENLLILNTDFIFVGGSGLIDRCYLQNTNYPFTSYTNIRSLTIFGCISDGYISGVFENIETTDCAIIHYQNIVCLNNLLIKNSKSKKNKTLHFANIYVGNDLIIDNANDGATFTLSKNTPQFVLINNLKIITGIKNLLFSNSEEELVFHINSIEFKDFSFSKDAIWKLEKLLCSSILFYNFRNFGSGNIDNTKGGSFNPLKYNFDELLKVIKPFNTGYAEFFNSDPSPIIYQEKQKSLIFRQSDFGKLNFINTDFSDFKLYFYSTKLNEIFLAGSKMPKTVDALDGVFDPFHQRRIANSQLKKLHEQQGDIVAANEYFANEMNAYFSSLRWGKFWKKPFWEKLHLGLNKVSSNHGQSWILALLVTLSVSILFYTWFCYLINYSPADITKSDNWRTFWKLFPSYFEFINPIHKLDDFNNLIHKSAIPSFAKTLDALSRIIDSYFIYQLIQAFRKHGRSK